MENKDKIENKDNIDNKPFWNKKWGKDKICPISHTRLRPGKNKDGLSYTIMLKCKHMYYRQALKNWYLSNNQNNNNCPICRTKFKWNDILK